jgi:hypothetical protein
MKQLRITAWLVGCLLCFAAPALAPDQRKHARSGLSASRIRAVLDRIEGDIGVIYMGAEEQEKVDLPIKYLPAGVKGGTVLRITIEIDHAATQELRKNIERKQKMKDEG